MMGAEVTEFEIRVENDQPMTLSTSLPISAVPCVTPIRKPHYGKAVTLEPLEKRHVTELWEAARGAKTSWAYLRYGPFDSIDAFSAHVDDLARRDDQPFWGIKPKSTNLAQGWISLCDISPADASIEIGSIWLSPALQRTRAATEAVFLLLSHVFDELGYLRAVWRCQALNSASRRAAERYGFRMEGIWRNGAIIKGCQRDVVWHSMLASEWVAHKKALMIWLGDKNFDIDNKCIRGLREIRNEII